MKTCCCHSKQYVEVENQVICKNEDCSNFLKTTQLTKPSIAKYMVAMAFFGFFLLQSRVDYCFSNENYTLPQVVAVNDELPLTGENLKAEIVRQEIFCAEKVYAQIQLESGRLNSFLAKRANNLLGMRYPFKRSTTAIGIFLPAENKVILGSQEELLKYRNQNHYAVYANWQECVKDYKMWQAHCFKLDEKYVAFLGT